MITYSVKVSEDVTRMLNRVENRMPEFMRRLLGRTGQRIVTKTQVNYLTGQVLHIRTGHLRESIFSKMIGPNAVEVGAAAIYAAIHEFGGIIVPRNAKALIFQINGRWVRVQRVVMPKRPFVEPAIDTFFSDGEAESLGEATLQQFLDEVAA